MPHAVARLVLPFADLARAVGWRRAPLVAARWLLRREYVAVCREIRRPLPAPPAHPAQRWSVFTPSETPVLRRLNPALGGGEIGRRIAEGQTCLLSRLGDAPAHYRWDARGTVYLPYLARRLRLDDRDSFIVEVFTDRRYRDRGLTTAGALIALGRAADAGCTRFLALIPAWNGPSLRTGQKAGMRVVGTVGCSLLGPWRRYFATGAVRFDRDGALQIYRGGDEDAP